MNGTYFSFLLFTQALQCYYATGNSKRAVTVIAVVTMSISLAVQVKNMNHETCAAIWCWSGTARLVTASCKFILQQDSNWRQNPFVWRLICLHCEAWHNRRVHICTLHICVYWTGVISLKTVLVNGDWYHLHPMNMNVIHWQHGSVPNLQLDYQQTINLQLVCKKMLDCQSRLK